MRAIQFIGATAVAMLSGATAFAQSAPEAGASGSRVDEIIVTAQKREERLQDVPAAITAMSGDTLDQLQITNPTDLPNAAPSLQYYESNTARGIGFNLRGVGTTTFGDGVEQSVGTVIDGVVMGRPGMGVGDFADIERVEVLRGPQGMLFGKNSSAGVISITTNRPHLDDWSLSLRTTQAEHGEERYQFVGNAPVGDEAALRVVGYSNDRDAIIHDLGRDRGLNGRHEQGVRASFLVEPTSDLSFLFRADYSDRNVACCLWTARSPALFVALDPRIEPGPTNTEVALSGDIFAHSIAKGASLETNWSFGRGYQLTAISAVREWDEDDNNDPDETVAGTLDINFGETSVQQFSQEVRVASPVEDRINWIAGLYWFKLDSDGRAIQEGDLGFPPFVFSHTLETAISTESLGIFAQANFDVTDRLRLIAGARYTEENTDFSFDHSVRPGAFPPPGFVPLSFDEDNEETNVSWRLGMQYTVTPDLMVYATAARGFKGAAANTFADAGPNAAFVAPEIPTSYELGLKSTLFDGRALFNVALFHTTFEDFQAQVYDTSLDPAVFRLKSAGSVVTQGVELDFLVHPVEGLTIGGAATYTDAFVDESFFINCYVGQTAAQGCQTLSPGVTAFDADGQSLAFTPQWAYSFYGGYQRPVANGVDGFVQLNWNWRDDVDFSLNGDPSTVQGAYGLLGLSFGIASNDERWRASVFARNLLDQHYVTVIFPTPLDPTGYSQIPSAESERTVGVTLEVNF